MGSDNSHAGVKFRPKGMIKVSECRSGDIFRSELNPLTTPRNSERCHTGIRFGWDRSIKFESELMEIPSRAADRPSCQRSPRS